MQNLSFERVGKIVVKFLIASILLMAISIISMQYMEPTIGKKAISQLQKQLRVNSQVKDFHLSIFKEFPRLSLVLEGVTVDGLKETEFLHAEEVSLKMNVWDLMGGDYVFQSVRLSNTQLHVIVDTDSNGNWDIFNNSSDSSSLQMQWEAVKFDNVLVDYTDLNDEVRTLIKLKKGSLRGNINGSRVAVMPDIKAHIISIGKAQEDFVVELPIDLNGKIVIDTETAFYEFKDLRLFVAASAVDLSGTILKQNGDTYFDLNFSADQGDITGIKNALPSFITRNFADYNFSGKAALKCSYSGVFKRGLQPVFSVNFRSNKASINHRAFPEPILFNDFQGSFILNKYGDASVDVTMLKGKYAGNALSGSCKVKNFSQPIVDADFNGTLPFRLFQPYMALLNIEDGAIDIENLKVTGLNYSMDNITYDQLSGKVSGKSLEMAIQKNRISIPYFGGELMADDVLIIDSSAVQYLDTDVALKGSVKNFISKLVSPQSNDLAFDMSLSSTHLNLRKLNNLYDAITGPQLQKVSTQLIEEQESILARATGKFRAKVLQLTYDNIHGSDFQGYLFLHRKEYEIRGDMHTSGGKIHVDGALDRQERTHFEGLFDFEDIDIHQLFTQWEDFGQDFIKSRHMQGTLRGKSLLKLSWDSKGNLLYDDIDLISSINMADGYLKNFNLLESFSAYVDINDLRNIRFNNLRNLFIIRNGKIYIPAMFIQSNAMNLTVNGIHTFDHKIDYNIKVNGGQVLMNRFKAGNDIIPARRNGWFNLYFTINGTLPDNFSYKRDKKKVERNFTQSMVMRQENEEILRAYFPDLKNVTEPKSWKNSEEANVGDTEFYELIEGF